MADAACHGVSPAPTTEDEEELDMAGEGWSFSFFLFCGD
jgi:hypothetical protein